jgi:hypothetical protein
MDNLQAVPVKRLRCQCLFAYYLCFGNCPKSRRQGNAGSPVRHRTAYPRPVQSASAAHGLTRKRDELLGQFPEIAAELLRLRQRHATTPCFDQHIKRP